MPTLEERVAALEREIAALSAGVQAEALQPNYLTVNPDGSTGALFTGGVQLQQVAGATPVGQGLLAWLDSGGTIREYMEGSLVTGVNQLAMVDQADFDDIAMILLQAVQAGGAGTAQVIAKAIDAATGVLEQATIIDSLGRSSFLQLPGVAEQRLVVGMATTGAAIAANGEQENTVPHGLGATPVLAGAFPYGWVGAGSVAGVDATNVYTFVWAQNAVGPNVDYYWFAIG